MGAHCIFPYENQERQDLKTLPFSAFCPRRITLYCNEIVYGICENSLVCCGQCVGFFNHIPVYASIDGRVIKISGRKIKYNEKGYDILISKEAHGQRTWSDIPFYPKCSGKFFLNQLGINHPITNLETTHDVLWIDGVESEPVQASAYRLFLEECVKIILGANILAGCFSVRKVCFCIETARDELVFLLKKNLNKYKALLHNNLEFEIKMCLPQYPMPYYIGSHLVILPHIAIHAYNGYYEKMPVVYTWISVSGNTLRKGNFKIPIGTHISDILIHCGYERNSRDKFIVNGLISGNSVSPVKATVEINTKSLCVITTWLNEEKPCIGCGRCAKVCPVHLKPYASSEETYNQCIGCGNCSYVCPSHRRLSERIKRRQPTNAPDNKKSKGKATSAYVELAPEWGQRLDSMPLVSDAPPHIHVAVQGNRKKYIGLFFLASLALALAYLMTRLGF